MKNKQNYLVLKIVRIKKKTISTDYYLAGISTSSTYEFLLQFHGQKKFIIQTQFQIDILLTEKLLELTFILSHTIFCCYWSQLLLLYKHNVSWISFWNYIFLEFKWIQQQIPVINLIKYDKHRINTGKFIPFEVLRTIEIYV